MKRRIINFTALFLVGLSAVSSGCRNNENLPVTSDPGKTMDSVTSEYFLEVTQEEVIIENVTTIESELQTESDMHMDPSVEETTKETTSQEPDVESSTTTAEIVITTSEEEVTLTHETEGPTSQEATIEAPTTEVPTTEEPTTEPPTTEAPTTEAPVPRSLSVKVRGEHYIGDNLSAGDFTVTVTMSDGSTKKNPAGWSADQLHLVSSETVITVSYQGLTAQLTVSASERPTEAPTTEGPKEAPTDTPVEVPIQPQLSYDRAAAEVAWNIQKGIIESQAFNLDTMDYTGYPIQWSERLYDLACQRAKEIVDNFSHDGFHAIDASAENIAKNVPSAEMVINGWYNSSGHKKNMLGGWDYGAIAKYGNYWVALFSNTP